MSSALAIEGNHEEKIALARAAVLAKAPYFGDTIHGFVYVAVEGVRTMFCTPKMILGYDPVWALTADVDVLAADIAHEAHHFLRGHFIRGAMVDDPALFNLAGDLSINPQLVAEGWKLASDAVFPKQYGLPDNLTAEEYYELLKQMKQQQQAQGGGSGLPEPNDGEGDPMNAPSPDQDGQKPSDAQGKGKQNGGGGPQTPGKAPSGHKPKQGSGQGQGQGQQQPQSGQGNQQNQGGTRGVCQGHCGGMGGHSENKSIENQLDGTPELGRTPEEVKSIEKRTAGAIKKHVEQHGRGSVPGGLQDWADKVQEEPHVRWQDELAHVIRDCSGQIQSGGQDFSMRRPSKRSLERGFLRPGMIENLPEVAILRDSSGSMGKKQLTDAARESFGIMQGLGIDEVWFVDADTDIAMPWKRVGPQFFRELTDAHGRGGTDFRKGITSALKLNPRPDLIVYLTDGDGTTTNMPPPNVAVVWGIVPSYYNKAPARWGHCVLISDNPAVRKKGPVYPDEAPVLIGVDYADDVELDLDE